MQEAFGKIIDFGLNNMRLKIITAFTHLENEKSKRLLEINNFQLDTNADYTSKENAGDHCVYYYLQQPF